MTNNEKHPNLIGAGGFGEHSDSCPDPYDIFGNECHEKMSNLQIGNMGMAEGACSGEKVLFYPRDDLQNVFVPFFMDKVMQN